MKHSNGSSSHLLLLCLETSKFNYRVGTTYEYNYASEATTHIPGATEERSTVKMSAKVKLAVISKCEMTLQVRPSGLDHYAGGYTLMPEVYRFLTFYLPMATRISAITVPQLKYENTLIPFKEFTDLNLLFDGPIEILFLLQHSGEFRVVPRFLWSPNGSISIIHKCQLNTEV